jgi:hypothetical protein
VAPECGPVDRAIERFNAERDAAEAVATRRTLSVLCPRCQAPPGQPCLRQGRPTLFHRHRRERAAQDTKNHPNG